MGAYRGLSKHAPACGMTSRFIFILFAAAACGGAKEPAADTTSAPLPPPPNPTAAVVRNPCEHTGLWAECSLERRLKQSGFVVKKLDEKPERDGFRSKPIVYSLGASRLEAFFYQDEKAANSDLAQLDTVAVAPKGKTAGWPSTPTLIRSANLVAVLISQNPRQAERVALAITAGPPQPGAPR